MQAEYQQINTLVKETQERNDESFEKLLKQYEGLIVSVAEKYFNKREYSWRNWVNYLQSIFYMYVIQYNFGKVYFTTYITRKLYAHVLYNTHKIYRHSQRFCSLSVPMRSSVSQNNSILKPFSILGRIRGILEPESFDILCWYYYDGYTQQEIADKINRSQSWVYQKLQSIKKEVREKIK